MTQKDLLIIHEFLSDYRKDQADYERILKYADMDIPLQKFCGKDEDAKEVRERILKQTQEKIAEIDRLLHAILNETIDDQRL